MSIFPKIAITAMLFGGLHTKANAAEDKIKDNEVSKTTELSENRWHYLNTLRGIENGYAYETCSETSGALYSHNDTIYEKHAFTASKDIPLGNGYTLRRSFLLANEIKTIAAARSENCTENNHMSIIHANGETDLGDITHDFEKLIQVDEKGRALNNISRQKKNGQFVFERPSSREAAKINQTAMKSIKIKYMKLMGTDGLKEFMDYAQSCTRPTDSTITNADVKGTIETKAHLQTTIQR